MPKIIVTFLIFFIFQDIYSQSNDCITFDTTLCYFIKTSQSSTFSIEKKWQSTDSLTLTSEGILMGYSNGYCIPLIFKNGWDKNIEFVDLKSGKITKSFQTPSFNWVNSTMPFVIADVDLDGESEIIYACADYFSGIYDKPEYFDRLICYELDGTIKWISDHRFDDINGNDISGTPSLVDFNKDGIPEVYILNKIFNAQTGKLLLDGGNNGIGIEDLNRNITGIVDYGTSISIAGQFDSDTTDIELAAGYTVYKINITNPDGLAGNSIIPYNINVNNRYRDGKTMMADINHDGILDIVVISSRYYYDGLLYAYSFDTGVPVLLAKIYPNNTSVIYDVNIVNLNNSNSSIIIVNCGGDVVGYSYDGSNTFKENWIISSSGDIYCSKVVFDFNYDGIHELVCKSQNKIYIYNIPDDINPVEIGSVDCNGFHLNDINLYTDENNITYLFTYCDSEIWNYYFFTVFGSPDNTQSWPPVRNIWNQYNYHVLNINDDLTVPRYMKNNATYENGRYNNFRVQQSLLDEKGNLPIEAPNLSATIHCVRFDPVSGVYTVSFDLCNASDASKTAPDQIPVSFYDGDPESSGQLLGTYLTTQTIAPGDTLYQLSHTFTASGLSQVVVVVNTDKTGGQPLTDEDFSIRECDFTDNFYVSLDLPAIDTVQANICEGDLYTFYGTILSSPGTYYHTLTGQSGCDSLITVLQLTVSGTFVVETSVTACDGYQWRNFYETMSGMYVQVVENPHACDSLFILHLKINHSFTATESASACDSYTWQGNTYTESGTYNYTDQTIHGCDSILTLQLTIHPSEWVTIQHTACDSYTWNAQTYTQSGVYTFQTFSSMGCDSIVQLDLTIVNQLEHHDDISVCAGDSVFIFDSWIQEAGDISQTFTAQSGCDSIQTYHVTIIDLPQREASATVCAGDSVFLYDRWFSVPDTYHLQLPNASGCDSLIHLQISELPVSERQEDYYLCRGDTGVVYGTMVTDAGMITTELTASTGCDSIIYTQVHLLENAAEQLSVLLCPGDSILIDGRWYAADDEVSQVFVAANGCDSTLTTRIRMIGEPSEPQMDIDCANRIIRLTVDASEDWLVMWDNGTSGSEAMYRDSTGATVNLHAIPGCDRQYKLDLPVIPDMSLYVFPGDTVVRVNEQITIDLGLDAGEWTVEWLPASVVDCSTCARVNISVQSNTDIAVRLTHESGCVYDIGFKLSIIRPNLLLPNVFSPNGDELNDTWKAVLPSDHQLISCEIFDRWGNLLFSVQQDNTIEWDGTFKGQSLMPGVYVFVMEYLDGEGGKQLLSSEITLLR